LTSATRLVSEYGPELAAAGAVTVKVAVIDTPPHSNVYASLPALVGVTVCVPLVAMAPFQAPLAVHEVAPVDDHVSVAL
jgi:hypothetical protein